MQCQRTFFIIRARCCDNDCFRRNDENTFGSAGTFEHVFNDFFNEKGISVVPILQRIFQWAGVFYKESDGVIMTQCQKCDYR